MAGREACLPALLQQEGVVSQDALDVEMFGLP